MNRTSKNMAMAQVLTALAAVEMPRSYPDGSEERPFVIDTTTRDHARHLPPQRTIPRVSTYGDSWCPDPQARLRARVDRRVRKANAFRKRNKQDPLTEREVEGIYAEERRALGFDQGGQP